MWAIIIPLVGGYALSAKRPNIVARLPVAAISNISLVLLLMVMGTRIGADSEVIGQFASIGVQAFILAWATVIGSTLILYLLQFKLTRGLVSEKSGEGPADKSGSTGYGLTLMLLGSVISGVALGLTVVPESVLPLLTEITTWVLGLLLLAIGLDLGQSTKAFANLGRLGFRIIFLPLGIALGSVVGAISVILVWDIMDWNEAAALASGFGWYSLSSVLLSELHSPILGAMAFITNVFRELIAIVITPLVAKWIGPLPSIGSAGATAMDVLLPVISKGAGREYVPLAFFTGAVLSLSVPFFVHLFMLI